MNDKSHISLEQRLCQVCGATFDTGSILLDKRLRASMERHTTTGWGLCPEHQKLFDDGYVAIIEIDPQKTNLSTAQTRVKLQQMWRTGRVAHIRREAFSRIFSVSLEADQACIAAEAGVIERLEAACKTGDDMTRSS
jgi:hypothetical protein